MVTRQYLIIMNILLIYLADLFILWLFQIRIKFTHVVMEALLLLDTVIDKHHLDSNKFNILKTL